MTRNDTWKSWPSRWCGKAFFVLVQLLVWRPADTQSLLHKKVQHEGDRREIWHQWESFAQPIEEGQGAYVHAVCSTREVDKGWDRDRVTEVGDGRVISIRTGSRHATSRPFGSILQLHTQTQCVHWHTWKAHPCHGLMPLWCCGVVKTQKCVCFSSSMESKKDLRRRRRRSLGFESEFASFPMMYV